MELLSPKTTLAVVLGASEWPQWKGLPGGERFASAGTDFRRYLTDENGFGLPQDNLLDLFDSEDPVSIVDRRLAEFLKKKRDVTPQDFLLYYVGHGGFLGSGRDYYLALRSSVEDIGSSVLRMQDLATTVRTCAPQLRRYVILDCCFAARAFQEFQGAAPAVAAREKTLDAFPTKGTALLCSSSAQDPSVAPVNAKYPMFTGALLQALREGSPKYPPGLSLNEVGEMVEQLVKEKYADEGVRPQVLSPSQDEGNIAKLPLFPNPAHRLSAVDQRLADQDIRLASMEASIRKIADQVTSVATGTLSAPPSEPVQRVPSQRPYRYGLSRSEWDSIPGDVRGEITRYVQAILAGLIWCTLTLACGAAAVLALIDSFGGRAPIIPPVLGQLAWAGVVIIGLFSYAVGIANFPRFRRLFGVADAVSAVSMSSENPLWESWDIVVRAQGAKLFRVVGSLYIASPYFEASLIVSLVLIGIAVLLGKTDLLFVP